MYAFLQDLRYALRTLKRSPMVSAIIVASLAIGIGANSAIFSVVNALLIKPLPYPDSDRLAVLWLRSPGINIPQDWPSPGQYVDLQNENRSFESMSISIGGTGTLLGLDEPQRVEILSTSSSLFSLLGAKALHGRLFSRADDVPGRAPVVVMSHGFWKRAFAGDPAVVGKTVRLSGVRRRSGPPTDLYEVVGVLGPGFLLNDEIMPTVGSIRQMDIFMPLPLGADAASARGDENYNIMARLKPSVTMARAKTDVAAIAARIREKDKRDRTFTIDVVPLVDSVVGNVRHAVLVLLGSVSLVLLIACANVANLLLTRAIGRQKEVAVRTALGASWHRLVRQLLTESLLLAVLGGVAGLLVAKAALDVVRTLNPGNIPRLEAISLDATVLVYTAVVSCVTGLLFGLAPALRAARVDVHTSMKAGGRSTHGDGGLGTSRARLRSLLVVGEVAVSLVLLVGAGLLFRSFVRLQQVSPGFDPTGLISMRLGSSARPVESRGDALAFYGSFSSAVGALPGVTMLGGVSSLPFTSSVGWGMINVEGWTPQPGQELQVDLRAATPNYFRAMRIPLLKGRYFTDADLQPDAQQVAIVDDKFARRFWPAGDAIGKQVWRDPRRKQTVVGVVGTVKQYGLDIDGRMVVYRPGPSPGYLVARTSTDPAAASRDIIRKIHELDPTITAYDVRTMTDRMSGSLARQRFSTIMLGAFAGFALVLAVVGVFGVMSHLVTQGSHDIGVRMALGADRGRILLMVLRQALELTGAGVITGLAAAALATRVMTSLLFGIRPMDVVTFATVPLILIATAMLASYLPAWRATRVDPVVVLRGE
jgi:predicted permease